MQRVVDAMQFYQRWNTSRIEPLDLQSLSCLETTTYESRRRGGPATVARVSTCHGLWNYGVTLFIPISARRVGNYQSDWRFVMAWLTEIVVGVVMELRLSTTQRHMMYMSAWHSDSAGYAIIIEASEASEAAKSVDLELWCVECPDCAPLQSLLLAR